METIFLVDDDAAVRKAISRSLREAGCQVETFDCAEAFLARPRSDIRGCLVLDVSMPGLDGLELQDRLRQVGQSLPIVFLTGRGDIPTSVRAIKAGATDFLVKPVSSEALLDAVHKAMEEDAAACLVQQEIAVWERRHASLTLRERQVLAAIVKGRLNKQIAADLGIVEQTVKFHRARIMERMQVNTSAELMHVAVRLRIAAVTN